MLSNYNDYVHHYFSEGDDIDDFQVSVETYSILGWKTYNTFGELREYAESLGLTAEFRIDTELYNEYQLVEINIKNSEGNITSSVSFNYMIDKYWY